MGDLLVNLELDILFFGRAPTASHVREMVEVGENSRMPLDATAVIVNLFKDRETLSRYLRNDTWLSELRQIESFEQALLARDFGADRNKSYIWPRVLCPNYRRGVLAYGWKDAAVHYFYPASHRHR